MLKMMWEAIKRICGAPSRVRCLQREIAEVEASQDERLLQLNDMYGTQYKSWEEVPAADLIYHLRTLLLEYSIIADHPAIAWLPAMEDFRG